MAFERPRGTRDFSPEDMYDRDYVEGAVSRVFESFGYDRILSPVFEYSELFQQKSGDEIKEHMYVFEDKGGRSLCLRPEETACVCRMFVSDLRTRQLPVKLYYHCPMYRYEEPQKGRYREFWQTGVELIGSESPDSDAEVVAMASLVLKGFGLDCTLNLSHMGVLKGLLSEMGFDDEKQGKIIALIDKGRLDDLKEFKVDKLFDILSLEGGVDAIEKAQNLLAGHKKPLKALSELKEVARILDFAGVKYNVKLGMARGLEYYTGIIFEVRVKGLGTQDQVCGGGRYDNLIELFGGPKTPAVGFAFGFDRLVEAMQLQGKKFPEKNVDAYVAAAGDNVRMEAAKIALELRKNCHGKIIVFDLMGRKLGKALEHASNLKAKYAVIVGEKELAEKSATLKDMVSGGQEKVKLSELPQRIK